MLSTEFIITSLIVVLIPGTGVIYTISTGLFIGWRASIFAAFGCAVGIVPHLLASILGLATILHMSAIAFQLIKFIGVAYLLYLAWSMWKETGTLKIEGKNSNKGAWEIGIKGFLINILNPKLSLFFLAFLPQFVPPETESPIVNMLLLSGIFMGMTLFVFILYGLFANSVRSYVAHSPNIIKMAQRTFAVVFAMLGAKLAMAER
ncbi:MAG: LysE family translocator [Candidatus Thiodiazotropha sp. (ex Monitilora ramsayi)]|nr:LysE family translocator [Candidatus Thiodiazotropha sp. (ex Monitilora ramsayi)]